MGKTKVCSKCGKELPIEMFNYENKAKGKFKCRCKQCDKEKWKVYYEKHRLEILEKSKIFSSERHKRYYDSHKLEYKESLRRRRKNNPKLYNMLTLKRQSKIKKAICTLTSKEWEECLKFFNNCDAYTGLQLDIPSQDHIIPLSKGGGYVKQNIIPCEKSINSSKNNKDMETWYRKQSFFSEERLIKIHKWMGVEDNIQQLKII